VYFARLDPAGLLGERDRAKAAQPPRAQAERLVVERDLVARLDLRRKALLDLLDGDRCRQHDTGIRGAAGQLGDHDERFARERRSLVDVAAAPVDERERAAAAVLGDAIRIGERKDDA